MNPYELAANNGKTIFDTINLGDVLQVNGLLWLRHTILTVLQLMKRQVMLLWYLILKMLS